MRYGIHLRRKARVLHNLFFEDIDTQKLSAHHDEWCVVASKQKLTRIFDNKNPLYSYIISPINNPKLYKDGDHNMKCARNQMKTTNASPTDPEQGGTYI